MADFSNFPESWKQFAKPGVVKQRPAKWQSLNGLLDSITPNRERLSIPARARAFRSNSPIE